MADLVRYTKQSNPQALVIGYSSAVSAISDWRVNLVDLEAVAREGHLDAFIDQTRGGAWNEVGVRENLFWNSPYMGWTYQLGFVLMHAAVLADTPTRHYVLTETFDAWESWDTIHTAPERLRWGIWAYHHAAFRRPGGIEMPAGTYISWGNQGKELLSTEDVAFLEQNLNDAIRDARATTEVYGPTLVYNRGATEGLMQSDPTRSIGEWIDDLAATVMKWPVPILSAARIEDLPDLDLELPVVQTPVRLEPRQRAYILDRIASGRPIALVGSPAGGLDPAVARAAGLVTADESRGTPRRRGAVLTPLAGITDGLPTVFETFQPFTRNVAGPGSTVVHAVEGSPTLLLNLEEQRRTLVWDPPDLEIEPLPVSRDEPLVTRLGSVVPYVTVARVLSLWLRNGEGPWVERIQPEQPVSLSAWRLADGTRRLLLGNLEEGLVETAGPQRSIEVSLPPAWAEGRAPRTRDLWERSRSPRARGGSASSSSRPKAASSRWSRRSFLASSETKLLRMTPDGPGRRGSLHRFVNQADPGVGLHEAAAPRLVELGGGLRGDDLLAGLPLRHQLRHAVVHLREHVPVGLEIGLRGDGTVAGDEAGLLAGDLQYPVRGRDDPVDPTAGRHVDERVHAVEEACRPCGRRRPPRSGRSSRRRCGRAPRGRPGSPRRSSGR